MIYVFLFVVPLFGCSILPQMKKVDSKITRSKHHQNLRVSSPKDFGGMMGITPFESKT